ncbi:MAG: DEAD/DEAH box helicase [Nitrospirota bacterium]|nr:DEAD/DEAH box helicase [Nitrospirota bacterium]
MPLTPFHPVIADWFRSRFGAPTEVQAKSWPVIVSGSPVLIAAPTGSGKTLAAFLACLDTLFKQALGGELTDRTQVLYVSPLKALGNDIQKNLQEPLAEIADAALAAGLLMPELRVSVRTGDTPAWDRLQMLRRPPHILITTPESLYLLLTSQKSRQILRDVRTVIVDEIHAVAPNKRGAHLALSLARLDAVATVKPVRIGLSATQRPIEAVASFLAGDGPPPAIVDVGHRRRMDLAVDVPKDELGAVATNAIWSDLYDRVAELVRAHRSTLVFVNTRRLVERVAHHLEERLREELGEQAVAAHHGSLSRHIRLSAEERLKRGETRVVVATASLELGIDIGTVDLVCQIGSPRSIAVALQRVGRSGHWVGAMPKGRLFATTRDELIECAALMRAIRAGTLDRLTVPPGPLDILAQQMVAAVAVQEWTEEGLYALCRQAAPYRDLSRRDFEAVLRMLAEGMARSRGRATAYLHHDRINRRIRARRGARLVAITSGGAIADTANYAVIAEPEGTVVGSVDEDFAVESLAGDIILLGNTSWRIRGIETGKMRVEDAHGAPPTIPFWRGEAPARTAELSAEVAAVREAISIQPSALKWLQEHCGLDRRGAEQAVAYVLAGREALGVVPTQATIVAERFFDEGGGMQLVLHAPFGGRLNRAWGLALRKRFCATFDFELQAAATDEGIVLSLGERHSFPLESVFGFLRAESVREVLIQAVLQAPMFMTRWRWNAQRSLALPRFTGGKKVPPQIQRMRAEDLLASVFPDATACQENIHGPRAVPDHPLVGETLRDCLTEAMDLDGLEALLRRIESGEVRCLARDTPAPSPFCHEILNANPYAFLDDAPLEERRARAVEMRRSLPADLSGGLGSLSAEAIAEVEEEAWPVVRSADELHDALLTLYWVPAGERRVQAGQWASFLPPLIQTGRACSLSLSGQDGQAVTGWAAVERLAVIEALFPDASVAPSAPHESSDAVPEQAEAVRTVVQGWMESTGPTTAAELATSLCLSSQAVDGALLQLEAAGQVLRGHFRPVPVQNSQFIIHHSGAAAPEWCDRRLLARIHRLTIGMLRKEIEPVTAADFMKFLFQWQHVTPGSRLHGEAGLQEVIGQLAGYEAAASAWERFLLPCRLSKYDPGWLDRLCLGGTTVWGRLSPHPRLDGPTLGMDEASRTRRIMPTSVAPISVFPREDAGWLLRAGAETPVPAAIANLGPVAQDLHRYLRSRGASFFADLVTGTGHLQTEVEGGLWELAAAGLVTADGFDNLRALLDPKRRRAEGRGKAKRPARSAGRWSLLRQASDDRPPAADAAEPLARQFLRRYGVVFRDLLSRESLGQPWRDLLVQYRRMESRGEIRGGRFVAGFVGEQFALPEAVESLRALRRAGGASGGPEIKLSGADPLNLAGIILPGPRVPALPSNYVVFRDGVPIRSGSYQRAGEAADRQSDRSPGDVIALPRRD